MRCHYCESAAEVTVEKDHVRVGLCEEHLREQLTALSESGRFDRLESEIDDAFDA